MRLLKTQIPAQTSLFHGSNEPLEFDPKRTPMWFSNSESVAEHFSRWHGKTRFSRTHRFQTTEDLNLLRIENRPHLESLLEDLGYHLDSCLGGEDDYDGLVRLFSTTQTDGWIIRGNYPDGDDICIASLHKLDPQNHPCGKSPRRQKSKT